ncbi:type II secretion system protein GspM [Piscinibacter sakaiensis]|uniref:General secretion pathway protein M n=1 Tax=Piscinibacter sakaiensis TaxID=1547922 RepID=A0A0K8NW80_PISS1|nr:type II secretion system protein GspM [Piscinibacter sakaiensis]GAP34554.1 general secretion pathway protein M [Piscinibacter sakaiensis]
MTAPDSRPAATLQRRWQALAPRERLAIGAMATVVGLALAWLLALQPALRTLREAPRQIDQLDARLQAMQGLAAETAALRAAAPVGSAQATAALQAATEGLGGRGRLQVQGDRATLTLTGVETAALQEWLQLARSAARARPVEAQLARSGNGYSGTLVLALSSAP